MKPPEGRGTPGLIAEWLGKADEDFLAAEVLLSQDPPLAATSCFHSQQAAEKCLKALLVLWGIEPPKIHDLGRLLRLVESHDPGLAHGLIDVVILNDYAVDSRYPGCEPGPTVEETRGALDLARRVRDAILPLLPRLPGSEPNRMAPPGATS